MSSEKKIIVVLGPHRSGTSAVARALTVFGIQLGQRLMPAAIGENDKGFWEDLDINALNIEMLDAVGKSWLSLLPLSEEEMACLLEKGFVEKAALLLERKQEEGSAFGFKDPRITQIFPVWKEVFTKRALQVSYVLVLRHPSSVADSLFKRNNLAREHGYLLWVSHVLSMLSGTQDRKKILVDYDRLMDAPETEIRRLGVFLDMPVLEEKLDEYKNVFLDASLRHTRYDTSVQSPFIGAYLAFVIYKEMTRKASSEDGLEDPAFLEQMKSWQKEFDKMSPGLSLADALLGQLRAGQIAREEDQKLFSLTRSLLEDENRELTHAISDLKKLHEEHLVRIESLEEENVLRGRWGADLDNQLKVAQTEIIRITSGNSWKLTRPLREGRRWLMQPKTQLRRYSRLLLGLGRMLYDRLPFDLQTRTRHRLIAARYLPMLLRASDSVAGHSGENAHPALRAYPVRDVRKFAANLMVPIAARPLVSVIIPVYSQIDYTLRCLASIAEYASLTPFEVIVVDDASGDETANVLQTVKGIRLIRKALNEGFIRACNSGAVAARGEYLCFLNNDTQVTQGWLDELVRTFEAFPGTGLAGSKLLYPDGRLQEAGCIIWRDGSAWNFGRDQDASLPVYNYAREVDYCSGASIMVPKNLFDELGGFDEHYLPAYAEDADLALKIRERGCRVIYHPLSVVYHFEGSTAGTDTSRGAKSYQEGNLKKLYSRWRECLERHQANGEDVDNAKDRRAKRRVLLLDLCTPTPDQDSGSIDTLNLMMLLREMDFQVTFIPVDNFLYMPRYTQDLQRMGVESLYAPFVTSVREHLMECGSRYDLVFMFRVGVAARHMRDVRKYCKNAKVIFNTVDLHYLRLEREARLQNDPEKLKFAESMKMMEHEAIRAADIATVISSEELRRLRVELPEANVHLLPFARYVDGTCKLFPERRDIIFIGGYKHPPNTDAVLWFVSEILPLLRVRIPGIKFYAVGSDPPADVRSLAARDVIITGYVKELAPILDNARLSVAPLRYGAGIKGKIGTSLAAGLPVVATSLACEGMGLADGEAVLIADKPEDFADRVQQVYQDEALWLRLSNEGVAFAEKAWGVNQAWQNLEMILRPLGFSNHARRYPLSLYREYRAQTPEEETLQTSLSSQLV